MENAFVNFSPRACICGRIVTDPHVAVCVTAFSAYIIPTLSPSGSTLGEAPARKPYYNSSFLHQIRFVRIVRSAPRELRSTEQNQQIKVQR
jgi:hypothetical protein